MPLSPETLSALDEALTAVIDEAGDDPQYAKLVDDLTAARGEIDNADDGDGPDSESDPKDAAQDDEFKAAEAEHVTRRKARKKPKDEGDKPVDAGADGGNPFA